MDDRLDELVRHVGIIGLLHGGDHVRVVLADTLDQRVVGHLHTLPALVTVHGIVTADHRGDLAARLGEVLFELGDEALAAVRVGIAAVHEAVHVGALRNAVLAGDVTEFEEVLERRVYAAVRGQAHEVHADALRLGIFESLDDLGIPEDRVVAAGAVDLHEVLVDHTAGADIEVAHLRVAHLSVGQADVLAVGAQFGMGVLFGHGRDVCGMYGRNDIGLVVMAVAPAIENHQ